MRLIDSHCHLQQIEAQERERVLDEAREAGVRGFLVPAVRLEEADELLAFCARHADVWCALGVHPHEASSWGPGSTERLDALLREPKVVAVGECGLDFHYDYAPRTQQIEALRAQWALAIEHRLPAVVHNRESDETMLEVLRRPEFAPLTADFHSFAGSPEMLTELLARGFLIGFSGMVTFQKADNIRALLAQVPMDRILVETDTPFLAPAPHRGKPNRPAWTRQIADRVALERGVSLDELALTTTENFFRLFSRAGRSLSGSET